MARGRDLARLSAKLDRIPQRVREALEPALLKSADEIASAMRRVAPEDEGDLIESITVTPPGSTTPPNAMGGAQLVPEGAVAVTAGNTAVRYAHLQEFGTERMDPNAYFFPTYRLYRIRAARRITRAMRKAIKEEFNK
ncbi:HK97-gp10 family putative phage morphogenesis protein [Mongoliimonas terrestris]|uniref:HK97-gp10 family putative phage morphogenesis protein n=1 Tax=Mongoliimonas terrestris TaxID=1709001 RepID=UPI000949987A|nr:HK97-gp10 family putative phage morphogenesis protein [Mongoliimonas terrestris]